MKRVLLKVAIFFSFFLFAVVALFVAPYPEEFAYHFIEHDCYNHGAWIFDRIKNNSTPIDIAFIGSSHTIHAWQDQKIEQMLDSRYHIANLGYCRYGRDLEYVLLRMLLENETPQLIVFEVHEDEEKNSHEIFPYLATTKDLLKTPTPFDRDYLADIFNGASARLEYFKAKFIFRKTYPEPYPELYGYAATDRIVTEIELKENQEAWQKRQKRKEIPAVEKIQMKYPLAYLEKMIGLIKEKNIPFLFIYLPEYGSKQKSPKYASYYQHIAPLLIPPQEILDEPSNWMDASHFNDKGSGLISEWLTEQLKSELCVAKDK